MIFYVSVYWPAISHFRFVCYVFFAPTRHIHPNISQTFVFASCISYNSLHSVYLFVIVNISFMNQKMYFFFAASFFSLSIVDSVSFSLLLYSLFQNRFHFVTCGLTVSIHFSISCRIVCLMLFSLDKRFHCFFISLSPFVVVSFSCVHFFSSSSS